MNATQRAVTVLAALAALAPFAMAPVQARTVDTTESIVPSGTPIDAMIDLAVAQRVAAQNLPAADARLLREQLQLQFMTLAAADQRDVMAAAQRAKTDEAKIAVVDSLTAAVRRTAEAVLASVRDAQKVAIANGIQPKLGGDGDQVYVATAGPCRVTDTRNTSPLAAFSARQIFAYSTGAGYSWAFDQGGTGTAGSGNCAGTVFTTTPPGSVVAIVTAVNTSSTGALQAWNGGTTLSSGAVVVWNPGDRAANTTVIPLNRFITAFPSSGSKRDMALNNNSSTPIDYVVDVLGYFIDNQATALDCQRVVGVDTDIPANSSILISTPACPTGYTSVIGGTTLGPNRFTSTLLPFQCRLGNLSGGILTGSCDAICCRVPGR
ncbi:MAG: hypothetical protein U1F15_06390 [Burkholderiales bacterium]